MEENLIFNSSKYKTYQSVNDFVRCKVCKENHGKIYEIGERLNPYPPVHPKCRCIIVLLKAMYAGTATGLGREGADWYLKYEGELPDYYITLDEAIESGWNKNKRLSNFFPGKMLA